MAKKYNKKKKSKYPGYMSFTKGLGLNPAYGEDGGKLYYQQDIGTLPPNFGRETFEFNKKQPLEFGKKPLRFAPARFIETPPTGLAKIEKNVNEYLGYPMGKAIEDIEQLAIEGNDPADNLRHSLAGMYTGEAIANKFPKILQDYTPIPKAVGFLGSNILGVGHELSALQNRELEGLGTELMTSAEDLYNNLIGSGISALPFMTTQQKANLLREMSDRNLLPDGVYDVNEENLYLKKSKSDPGSFAGYKKKQGGWLDEFEEGGFMGKTTVEAGGAKHVVYTGKKGDIMVTHPEMDNGAWDTINLTEVSDAKSLAQGVDATLDWHRKHPYHKKKKAYGGYTYQDGGRTPIYVDNPRDPRLRAYNDSLNVYNVGERDFNEALKTSKYKRVNNPSNYYYQVTSDLYNTRLKPESIYEETSSPYGGSDVFFPRWKKPVQPYKYKKPEVVEEKKVEPVVTKEVKKEEPIDRSILTYRITELPKEEQRGNQRYVATVVPETYQKYGTGFAERYPLTQEQYDAMGATDTMKSREGKDVPVKYIKKYGGKYRAPKYNDKRIGRGDDGGEVWLYQQDMGYLPKFLGTKTVGLQSGFSNALKNAVARNTEQQKEDTNKGYTTVLTDSNIASREGSGPYLTNEVYSEGDAAAESTSIPGLIRFAKNPIKALEGTLSSADRFIIGLSPFSKMTGTYSDFKPEELEGLSNTLDAAGVVSSVLPLAKTIPLPKGLQKVNRFLNKVEPLPKAQFPPDYNPNIPPTRSYDLNLLVEDWTDISNGLPARNYPDLPLERNEYFQDLILENQRRETQRRLNLRQQNPPGWEYLNSGTANKSKVNKSGLTKEEAIAKAAEKDKDKLSKMTETEFENTVVKPNGEIVEYTPAMDLNLQWNQESRKTLVPEAVPLSSKEFEDLFNSRLDLADEIIASRNKSGVEYKLKGLKNNQLTFYTPKQEIPVQLSPKQIENIELFNKDPKDFLVNKAGLQQTPDGKWTVMHVDEEFDSIDDVIKFVKEELDNEIKPKVIEGESTWDVDINPGLWEGQVQDIANVDYYKSIPGLDMENTMSRVFADRLSRKGTGAYESINEFLKRLNLGRVKPGFNSQTDFSRGAWENFINSGRGVGFYGNPSTVYGSLKSALPYVGISGTGALYLNNKRNRNQEYKQGGWLDEL